MVLNASLAAVHYLALAIGFAGICMRASALLSSRPGNPVRPIIVADNMWGLAALLWISTGLIRAFAGFEKGTSFYLHSTGFWMKMSLFLLVFMLEFKPMMTFIGWRRAGKVEIGTDDLPLLEKFAKSSRIQVALTLIIPFVASMMARGVL
jgi:putative membrane protein